MTSILSKFMGAIQIHPFTLPALASLLLLWLLTKWIRKPDRNKNPPPSPPKFPIIGNLHQMGTFPHHDLHVLARKHGPIMLLHFGSVPVLVVSSAESAREIMRTHDVTFSDRPITKVQKRCFYNCRDVAFAPYGDHWRQAKGNVVVKLLNSKRIQSFGPIRAEETGLFVKRIRETPCPVNLSKMFADFATDGICRSALGRKFEAVDGQKSLPELVNGLSEVMGAIDIGEYIPRLSWISRVNGLYKKVDLVVKGLDDIIEDVIAERLLKKGFQEKETANFVDIMLEGFYDNAEGSFGDRDTMKALILDAFAAGTETTPIVLEWAMAELLRHPTVMERLQNEVREIVKDKEEIPEGDLEEMHYLKAVIKETLRVHPPFPLLLPRITRRDVNVSGYSVSAGTITMVNVWTIGRDPALWEDPEEFKPERFLESSIDYKGLHFELTPFGAGRRICPGITYSMAMIELLLANLLQKFDWKLPDGDQGKDLDMTGKPGITVRRAIPLLAVATEVV